MGTALLLLAVFSPIWIQLALDAKAPALRGIRRCRCRLADLWKRFRR